MPTNATWTNEVPKYQKPSAGNRCDTATGISSATSDIVRRGRVSVTLSRDLHKIKISLVARQAGPEIHEIIKATCAKKKRNPIVGFLAISQDPRCNRPAETHTQTSDESPLP
ncbi:hypothetical protein PoB_004725600 [Plakobranchus ocellatus]|uniref:Uncharacterized protein n=1 Tax=Plakobranchus ocellatus TaxID=259542 RepID=A0AAV4BK15_9GAST|nr:hypothetical protein PoB_004725600 [Plakobranchus ocellatus]